MDKNDEFLPSAADHGDTKRAALPIVRVGDEWGRLEGLVDNAAVVVVVPIGACRPQSDQ